MILKRRPIIADSAPEVAEPAPETPDVVSGPPPVTPEAPDIAAPTAVEDVPPAPPDKPDELAQEYERVQEAIAAESRDPDEGTAAKPVTAETKADVDRAAHQAEPEPTDAQRESGAYKKGHLNITGLQLSIENAKGSTRRGKDADGETWEVTMPAHYGYVRGTEGADGDQVDAYIGEDPQSERVWVVDQVDADTKEFDEHKAFLGFSNYDQVKETYDAAFSDGRGPDRRKIIRPMSMDRFKDWLKSGQTKKPVEEATIEKPATEAPAAASPAAAEAVEGEAAPEPAEPSPPTSPNVEVKPIEVTGASRGETYGLKKVEVDGKTMAAADINILGDEVFVRDIETRPEGRRKGYAKRLVDDLFREYPDSRIMTTNTTPDGTAFFSRNYDVDEDGRIYPKGEGPAAPEAAGAPTEAAPEAEATETPPVEEAPADEAVAAPEPTPEPEAAPAPAETPTDQAETAPETPDVAPLVKADGTPYKSKRAAQGAITGRKLKGHAPVEVEGGWGLRPVSRETPVALPEGDSQTPAVVEREGEPAEALPEPPAPQPAEAEVAPREGRGCSRGAVRRHARSGARPARYSARVAGPLPARVIRGEMVGVVWACGQGSGRIR